MLIVSISIPNRENKQTMLLACCLLLLLYLSSHLTPTLAVFTNLAHHFGDYGAYVGSWNVSPEGARLRTSSLFMRQVTGLHADAKAMKAAFRTEEFQSAAYAGSVRDQIALLSRLLVITSLHLGTKEDVYEVKKKMAAFLTSPRRLSVYKQVLGPKRIALIEYILKNLNLQDPDTAHQMLTGYNDPWHDALIERSLLMMIVELSKADGLNTRLLKNFLAFYTSRWVDRDKARTVRVKLTPDVSELFAHLSMLACTSTTKEGVKLLREFVSVHMGSVYLRKDFVYALGFELDGLFGQRGVDCFRELLTEEFDLDRRVYFPLIEEPEGGQLYLRHAPCLIGSLYTLKLAARSIDINPVEHAELVDSDLDGMQVSVKLDIVNRNASLSVLPVNIRFMLVRIRMNVDSVPIDPTRAPTNVHDQEEESTVESVNLDTQSDSSSIKSTAVSTYACSFLEPCLNVEAQLGDIFVIIEHPSRSVLSELELRAINNAVQVGTRREKLLQIVSSLPVYTLYHAMLVEQHDI